MRILQHAEKKFTKRYMEDTRDKELNYIFIKHFYLLRNIKELLSKHSQIIKGLSDPPPLGFF